MNNTKWIQQAVFIYTCHEFEREWESQQALKEGTRKDKNCINTVLMYEINKKKTYYQTWLTRTSHVLYPEYP